MNKYHFNPPYTLLSLPIFLDAKPRVGGGGEGAGKGGSFQGSEGDSKLLIQLTISGSGLSV